MFSAIKQEDDMWQIERDEEGFWAVSGKTRVGPFIRTYEARTYTETNKAPVEEPKDPRPRAREREV